MKPLSKKERKSKLEEDKKRNKRKNRTILIVGILIFVMAVFQAVLLGFFYFGHKGIGGHNQIVLGQSVVTTEVCTEWFNESYRATHLTEESFYFETNSRLIVFQIIT